MTQIYQIYQFILIVHLFRKTICGKCENISPDLHGLGKSFKRKKLIEKNNEIYYHFPFGGCRQNKYMSKIVYEISTNK